MQKKTTEHVMKFEFLHTDPCYLVVLF